MSCAEVCIDSGEHYDVEFHWKRMRRARKAHKCYECGDAIAPGDSYEYVSTKCEGAIFTVHTCAACAAIREALVCGSFAYGDLWPDIEEGVLPAWEHTGPWDCLAKIDSPRGREKLMNAYREYREER